jgi:hypothetical protein
MNLEEKLSELIRFSFPTPPVSMSNQRDVYYSIKKVDDLTKKILSLLASELPTESELDKLLQSRDISQWFMEGDLKQISCDGGGSFKKVAGIILSDIKKKWGVK